MNALKQFGHDEFQITLDPQWSYEWNDGSTASTYVINRAGYYRVTMDDGCDETVDDISVRVIEPPARFTLGAGVCQFRRSRASGTQWLPRQSRFLRFATTHKTAHFSALRASAVNKSLTY